MRITKALRRFLQKPPEFGWLRYLLQGMQPRKNQAMAQGQPGKSADNSGQIPQETACEAGSFTLLDVELYPREAFRDVTPLMLDFMAVPVHIQKELFDEMDACAKRRGVTDSFLGFGTDAKGHWIGWTPMQ